jgi:hypothetical protein
MNLFFATSVGPQIFWLLIPHHPSEMGLAQCWRFPSHGEKTHYHPVGFAFNVSSDQELGLVRSLWSLSRFQVRFLRSIRGQQPLPTLKGHPQLSAAAAVHRRRQRSLKLGGGAHQDADLMESLKKTLEKNGLTAWKSCDFSLWVLLVKWIRLTLWLFSRGVEVWKHRPKLSPLQPAFLSHGHSQNASIRTGPASWHHTF